jgi:MFS family permease
VTDVEPAAARAPVRSNSLLLGQLSFLSGTAQEMVYPLIPTFVVVALGSSATLFGGIEGVLAFGVTLARLGSARALDRGFSPRRLLVASYLASLVSRPLLALAPNLATVAALRTVDGLGKGGKDAPKDSLVALDAGAGRAGRAFGVLRALDTAGSVAGPVIAGLLLLALGHGERGLRIVFALAAIPAVAGLLTLRQVRDAPPATPRHSGEARPPLPPAFKVLLVAALVFGLANSSDTLLLRARSGGLSAAGLAFAYALVNLVYAALAVPLGALSDRIGRRPLLFVSWGGLRRRVRRVRRRLRPTGTHRAVRAVRGVLRRRRRGDQGLDRGARPPGPPGRRLRPLRRRIRAAGAAGQRARRRAVGPGRTRMGVRRRRRHRCGRARHCRGEPQPARRSPR